MKRQTVKDIKEKFNTLQRYINHQNLVCIKQLKTKMKYDLFIHRDLISLLSHRQLVVVLWKVSSYSSR